MPKPLDSAGIICTLHDMTHADIINLWPSLAEFAADLSVEYGTAKAMRRRSSIPPKYWPAVVTKSSERDIEGITAEALMHGAALIEAAE